jgi:predicted MarR family transcription regulator
MTDLTLNILLGRIKDEADRLLAAESGLNRESAYQKAIASVVMTAAEEQAVTPFEARLLDRLDQAVRMGGGRPVATKRLAAELGGMDIWNIWYHLRRLEERGLVHRPEGPKSGWAVAA